MSLRLPLAVTFALLAGCVAQPPRTPPPPASGPAVHAVAADDNLNAVAWTQTAVEHDLIYLQTYRDAQARLLAALADPRWDALPKADRVVPARGLKPAVLLDIDETVLDNSPYQARLVRSGGEFNEADWAAWCKEAKARALPGVVAFTRFAVRHGVEVIYLSNRAKDLDQATWPTCVRRACRWPVRSRSWDWEPLSKIASRSARRRAAGASWWPASIAC